MNTAMRLLGSFGAGVVIGIVFFWGLWVTVDRIEETERPARRVLVSLVFRFALVLGALFALARYGGWPHALTGALGFTLMRITAVRRLRTRPEAKEKKENKKEKEEES